ncbi:MAG: hypothetical protein WAW59_05485 [Patescibacteria group bacterium]
MLFEESLRDEFEGFIFLGDHSYLVCRSSLMYLLLYIVDYPG